MIEKTSHVARTVEQQTPKLPYSEKSPTIQAAKAENNPDLALSGTGRAKSVEQVTASQKSQTTTSATSESVVAARTAKADSGRKEIEQQRALADAYHTIAAQKALIASLNLPAPEVKIIPS